MIELETVDSTNDYARGLIRTGQASDRLVVWAKEQTRGRGRRGRKWISPPGNLHCSMVVDVSGKLALASQTGFVAAVALVDALKTLLPVPLFQCKWPNDVLADGKKTAGMLLESEGGNWLVLGLGVDVAHAPPHDQIERPAASLAELGFTGTVTDVLDAFTAHMTVWLDRWRQGGFANIRAAWLERAAGLGGRILVRLDRETLTGSFVDLDRDGALIIRDDGGKERTILAGDVFLGEG